jgi:hypothetical protein
MFTRLYKPLVQWWRVAFTRPEPAVLPQVFRSPASRVRRMPAARVRPLTPFRAEAVRASAVHGARRAARHFWMTLDPQDRRRAAIGGSFAEVCAALERLAAVEEHGALR